MARFSLKCKGVVVLLLLAGCAHPMQFSQNTVRKIERLTVGKSFWLKQSLYAGQFYDDSRYQLLHQRPFDELNYVQMPDGATVLPPKNDKIIQVGTKVSITSVEWPDSRAQLNRPLFTPRNLPWMKMKIALDRGNVTLNRAETFIFLIPLENDKDAKSEDWFKSIFSDQDTNPWLLSQPKAHQDAILKKEVAIGMSREAVVASLGVPDSIENETAYDKGIPVSKMIASYAKCLIILQNNLVTQIHSLTPSTPATLQSDKEKIDL